MEFIKTPDPGQAIEDMARRISAVLESDRKVLWLVCGGSNIPVAVKTMDLLRTQTDESKLSGLTVAQTDERYGPVGHKDSNWAQLAEMGFNLRKIASIPVLIGKSLEATVSDYADNLKSAMEQCLTAGGEIIALFGIGSDSHIAGILPDSPVFSDPRSASGYEAGPFIRITMTTHAVRKVSCAYALAFGDSKKQTIRKLGKKGDIVQEPAQILKTLPQAYLYSDQL